jgi:hypothetical protein
MKSFEEYIKYNINEMGVVSGIHPKNSKSKEYDWIDFDKESKLTRCLLNNIGSMHYKLYRTGNSNFYLTTEGNEYLGQLEGIISDRVLNITSSNSKLSYGFYNIIFSSLLSTELITEILSDFDLSTNALNSYERLLINGRLLIQIYNPYTQSYIKFSKESFLEDINNIVSIKEKKVGSMKEHFAEYYKRIHSTDYGNPSVLNVEFNSYNPLVDSYLFCENFVGV